MSERMFKAIYESPWLAAAVGVGADALGRRGPPSATWEHDELKRLKRQEVESQFETGSLLDAWARLLLYVRREENVVDERPYNLMRRMIDEMEPEHRPSLAPSRRRSSGRLSCVALDEERAIAALPALIPEMHHRRQGVEAARKVAGARGKLSAHQEERFRRLATVLALDAPVTTKESSMSHEKYDRLIETARALDTIPTAVAHPCERVRSARAVEAARLGLIVPILVGPRREDRGGRRARPASTSAPARSSTPRTATTPPPRRSRWCATAGPRR